jgi:hypothetical protein
MVMSIPDWGKSLVVPEVRATTQHKKQEHQREAHNLVKENVLWVDSARNIAAPAAAATVTGIPKLTFH